VIGSIGWSRLRFPAALACPVPRDKEKVRG
jgi:hypothetical protein